MRIVCLLAVAGLACAGTVVQTGTLFGDEFPTVEPFTLAGHLLTGVDATFRTGVYWSLYYEFTGDLGVTLNPPARITSAGFAEITVMLPGMASLLRSDVVCESPISQTGDGRHEEGVSCSGGYEEFHLVGDPRAPEWTDMWPLTVGLSGGGVSGMHCEPGSPPLPCQVSLATYAIGDAHYTVTYTYSDIPEPAPIALVLFPLTVGAFASGVRRRR